MKSIFWEYLPAITHGFGRKVRKRVFREIIRTQNEINRWRPPTARADGSSKAVPPHGDKSRQYAEESQALLLRKQQSTIDKLRKDNDGIKADIAMIMRSSNRPMGASEQEKAAASARWR